MSALKIDRAKCINCGACLAACPFGSIASGDDQPTIGDNCRLCRICVKSCPVSAIGLAEDAPQPRLNKEDWRGILVFAELTADSIHPVTIELIGEAIRLAKQVNHPVFVLAVGSDLSEQCEQLLRYGVDQVFCYDYPELEHFRVDVFTNVFADCIRRVKPAIVLVGATAIGRSLAPRLAARFRTGLTADCTVLGIKPNSDLVQIRPAFGGNIMAQITTPNSRPQFATVRYRVMNAAKEAPSPLGTIQRRTVAAEELASAMEIVNCKPKPKKLSIAEADVLVVAGRGLRDSKDIALLAKLADLLDGQVAATRAVVEAGWLDHSKQIGLSGRTVKPKLIITCGVSGAVQFTAGMQNADCIIAINRDPAAPIFKVAHYGLVGDLYEIVPRLIAKLQGGTPV